MRRVGPVAAGPLTVTTVGAGSLDLPGFSPTGGKNLASAKDISCTAVQCVQAIYVCSPACIVPACPPALVPPAGGGASPFPPTAIQLISIQVYRTTIKLTLGQILMETTSIAIPAPKWWPTGVPYIPDGTIYEGFSSVADAAIARNLCQATPLSAYVGMGTALPYVINCVAGKSPANVSCTA